MTVGAGATATVDAGATATVAAGAMAGVEDVECEVEGGC